MTTIHDRLSKRTQELDLDQACDRLAYLEDAGEERNAEANALRLHIRALTGREVAEVREALDIDSASRAAGVRA